MRACACFAVKPRGISGGGDSITKHPLLFRRPLMKTFWGHCLYFLVLSTVGFLALKVSKPRTGRETLKDLDLFFTSVSAATVSSMSTVEMEVFSNAQLVFITLLMLLGVEIFTSMFSLHFFRTKLPKSPLDSVDASNNNTNRLSAPSNTAHSDIESNRDNRNGDRKDAEDALIKHESMRCLGHLVFWYLVVVHVMGTFLIAMYMILIPTAGHLIKSRGIPVQTFSMFVTVSTFANCGFVPTNENMIAFKENSGLLLIVLPQVLLGNTLFPPCLRLTVSALEKMTHKPEYAYLLTEHKQIRYPHLLSKRRSLLLVLTAFAFVMIQFIMFCAMEWNSESLQGLNPYQKLVGSLFVVVNSRHTGESIVDLSVVSPAILVLFIAMMYLPPYTSFSTKKYQTEESSHVKELCGIKRKKKMSSYVIFPQLVCLIIFLILICITERRKIKEDAVNFSILNIALEVISAYGNVGFSTGYSCKRRINQQGFCQDKMYGFVGRWSNGGKFILILVMFYGRLKRFSLKTGKAWKLS